MTTGNAPASFSWTLVEGDMLRALDGTYAFAAEADGTRVTYDLLVDLSVPNARAAEASSGRDDHRHRVERAQARGGSTVNT